MLGGVANDAPTHSVTTPTAMTQRHAEDGLRLLESTEATPRTHRKWQSRARIVTRMIPKAKVVLRFGERLCKNMAS
jgi:hypothetical protein